jgi:hypothetical protein
MQIANSYALGHEITQNEATLFPKALVKLEVFIFMLLIRESATTGTRPAKLRPADAQVMAFRSLVTL